MASRGYVVSEQDVPAEGESATASTRVTIDASAGCEHLEQRVVRFAPGRSDVRELDAVQEVLYVVSGRGELEIDGRSFALEPETAAYVAAGEGYRVHNRGPGELLVVSVRAPHSDGRPRAEGPRIVRYGEQQPLPATAGREFRHLVGSRDVTQFLGVIPPGRAPMHNHTYDEVAYVVEGEGLLHLNGRQTPIGPGTCIHLPPRVDHCLENTADGPMRVLGVFHPAGDPSSAYPANR